MEKKEYTKEDISSEVKKFKTNFDVLIKTLEIEHFEYKRIGNEIHYAFGDSVVSKTLDSNFFSLISKGVVIGFSHFSFSFPIDGCDDLFNTIFNEDLTMIDIVKANFFLNTIRIDMVNCLQK